MSLILVIDDDTDVHKLLNLQLKNSGYKIISAYRSETGIDMAHSECPDLILLDIMMPTTDGITTLKLLHFDNATKDIPVIMLTSKSAMTDVATAMKSGAADYMIKPYDKNSLEKKIDTAIKYGAMKRSDTIGEQAESVNVNREGGRTVIKFMTPLGDPKIIEELKMIFSKGFLAITVKDVIILDLRKFTEIENKGLSLLKAIFLMFREKDLFIIAGRHFVPIYTEFETLEKVHIYISYGDMELDLERMGKK